MNQTQERLGRVETGLKNHNECNEEPDLNRYDREKNVIYLYHTRGECTRPWWPILEEHQFFSLSMVVWTLNSPWNSFNTWTNISHGTLFLKLQFAVMKLTGQTSQYW